MTRVAIFTDNDFAKINGVTTTWKAVLRHAPDGVAPRVYTAADTAADDQPYYSARSVGVGLPWYREMRVYWPRPAALEAQVKSTRAEVIHIATPGPVGLAGRIIARRLRLPLTGSYHTHLGAYVQAFSGSQSLGALTDAYMRWLYNPCRPLLVPSQAALDALLLAGHRAQHLTLWPRGVDSAQFSPARRSAWLRWLWGVDDRRPALAYVGRLSRERGLHLLPLIQRELATWGMPHRLVIVGDGPMGAELRERCPDAAFLGQRPHDEVAVAMASADVLLFPSATDALGNVVLEGQASGLPVVVSDRGGPQEQIIAGLTGMVARAGMAVEFADAVRRILRDRDTLREMSGQARAFALTRTWDDAIRPLGLAWHTAALSGAAAHKMQAQPRDAPV